MGAADTTEWAYVLWDHCIQNEQVEQQICIEFYIKLEHSSAETIWKIQKAVAMGNWWLAALSQHHTRSCITSHAEFFGEASNHPGDSAPLQPRFGALWLLAFPKTNNHLWKGRDFRLPMRFRKIWQGSWWQLTELCEVSICLLWRGLRHHCPMYNVSLPCIFFNKCFYFSYYMAGYFLDRPHTNLYRRNVGLKKHLTVDSNMWLPTWSPSFENY